MDNQSVPKEYVEQAVEESKGQSINGCNSIEYDPIYNLKQQVVYAERELANAQKRLALVKANPGVLVEYLKLRY